MIYATVTASRVYATVEDPRRVFATITAPPVPVDRGTGLLFDSDTGAFLYDEVTGSPLTW